MLNRQNFFAIASAGLGLQSCVPLQVLTAPLALADTAADSSSLPSSATATTATDASTSSSPAAPARTTHNGDKSAFAKETKAMTMVKYKIAEGRFSMLLPGEYKLTDIKEMDIPAMNYACSAGHGTYNVSYAAMAKPVPDAELADWFNKFSASLIEHVDGTSSQQSPITLKYRPGRQIDVNSIKDKPDSGAIIRFYLDQNMIYVVSAVGEKNWLKSPAVRKFLHGFDFYGKWRPWNQPV
jgi:hypothetical protein